MPCIPIKNGFVCGNHPVYHFGGFTFELHNFLGPLKIRKDGTAAQKTGRKFYDVIERWQQLPKKEREKFRV